MALGHFARHCDLIPEKIREEIIELKKVSKSSDGGGKKYWGRALRAMDIFETESHGLVWPDTEPDVSETGSEV